MEKPKFPAIPKALLNKGEKDLKENRGYYVYHQRIIHEEEKDGKVWIYSWIREDRQYEPELITVMTPKCWKTWDGKKWGKRVINPSTWYTTKMIYDKHLDTKLFGYTIEELQQEKQREKTARANRKKRAIIENITSQMKEIPKRVKEWAHENLKHYILFEAGQKIGFCTNCAAHSVFDRLKNRHYVKCPHCGHIYEARTYKTAPKQTSRCFMWFQKCKGGFLLRTFRMTRWNPMPLGDSRESIDEYLCISMIDGEERWIEKRYYFDYGWKTDEEREVWYLNQSLDVTRNYLSMYCDEWRNARRFQGKPEELEFHKPATYGKVKDWCEAFGNNLKYIKDYVTVDDGIQLFKLGDKLDEIPQLEGLYKNGFTQLADQLLYERYYRSAKLNKKESELHKFLGIKKETFRVVSKSHIKTAIDCDILRVIQCLDETEVRPESYMNIIQSFQDPDDVMCMIDIAERIGTRVKKVFDYILTQTEDGLIRRTLFGIYDDYIDMCIREGVDMTDPFNRFPRNCEEAHDSMIRIREEQKRKDELKKIAGKDNTLAKSIEKVVKRFTLENDTFIIRPAMSATEIVKEGQNQHNCVGRAGYIDRMIAHKCMILFLRKKETPDVSFYTIETDMKGNLRQAYAANNKKTDDYDEVIKPLLNQLKKKVQKSGKKHIAAG